MGPIVRAPQVVPPQGMVAFDLNSSVLHRLNRIRVHLLCSEPVQQYVNFHPCTGAFNEGVSELHPDLALPVDEGFKRDGVSGRADRIEHGGEEFVPVDVRGDLVPAEGSGRKKTFH
jgi:hypothetical protein